MSKKSNKVGKIISILEEMIDVRYKYNHERSLENFKYSRKILSEEYEPLVEKLAKVLEKLLDENDD